MSAEVTVLAQRLVKCADCQLDLDPKMTVRAAFVCPLFGKPRLGVEKLCVAFVPKRKGGKGQP
jgi:hypothetical protein